MSIPQRLEPAQTYALRFAHEPLVNPAFASVPWWRENKSAPEIAEAGRRQLGVRNHKRQVME